MERRELAAASDEQLAAWAGAGGEHAFAVLVGRYRCRLVRYARRLLAGTGADPEDVVQDCMLAVLKALRGGTRPDSFGAWVHVIARNACVDAAQQRPAAAAHLGPGPVASESAHDAFVRRERLRAVIDDIAALSPTQRRAVLAREFEGRSYQQLADDHGTTVAAVKSLLFRARAALHARAEGRGVAIPLPAAIWARLSPLRKAAAAAAVPAAQKGAVVGACAVLGIGGAVSMPAPPRLSVQVRPALPPAHLIEDAITASWRFEHDSAHRRGGGARPARVASARRVCAAERAEEFVYEYAPRPEEHDCSE